MTQIKKGLIHIYTGDGKGKTTASVGQAVRAVGHQWKVCFVYFFKNPDDYGYGELEVLENLGVRVSGFAQKHPHFYKDISPDEMRRQSLEGVDFIRKLFKENTCNLLIIDEINIAVRDKYLKEEELLDLLDEKPPEMELILTGRGATERVIEKADLVTSMTKIKHHFDQGIESREGIEY